MISYRKNKKANAASWFAVIIFLFVFGIINIFTFLIHEKMIEEWATTAVYNDEVEAAAQNFRGGLQLFDVM